QAIERQTMKLRKKKKVIKKFSETGISLVLHGHLHENREYHRKKIKFLNSGGSVLGSNYLQFNEINTENNNIETKIIKTEKKYKLIRTILISLKIIL
ncbi:MAG: metallophosphoesterase, partial [Chlorobi bacterium OLB5]